MRTTPNDMMEACGWTRLRLPLFAESDGEFESSAEGGDLNRADWRRVRAHLNACSACRARWSALVRSAAVLSAAAVESPVEPYGAPLWQGLAARIEAAETARPSVWSRALRAVAPDRVARRLDRGLSGLPLHLAWLRDTIAHDLPDRARARFDRQTRASQRLVDRLIEAWVSPVGLGTTVALGAFLAALSLLHNARIEAGARIAAAAVPASTLPPAQPRTVPLLLAPIRPRIEAPLVVEAAEPRSQESESTAAEPEALAQNTAPLQPPPPPAAPAAKPAAARSYDYDLERGVPMPPDARIAKPAY